MSKFFPVLFLFVVIAGQASDTLHVAVASNMNQVFTEIAAEYKQETNNHVNLIFGSSGNFARQLIQGAPYNIFLSADKKYVDLLHSNGQAMKTSMEYVLGRIGFFIPTNSSLNKYSKLNDIRHALNHVEYKRIAIANPEFAPYGLAAQQALQSAGVWALAKSSLLMGESAAQAMQFTLSGGVDIGIVPASFAAQAKIAEKGQFFLIPSDWHSPIRQYLVLLAPASPAAQAFFHYLQSEKSKVILQKYGYDVAF